MMPPDHAGRGQQHHLNQLSTTACSAEGDTTSVTDPKDIRDTCVSAGFIPNPGKAGAATHRDHGVQL